VDRQVEGNDGSDQEDAQHGVGRVAARVLSRGIDSCVRLSLSLSLSINQSMSDDRLRDNDWIEADCLMMILMMILTMTTIWNSAH